MIVWLVTVGEPLPIEPGTQRLHRAGLLADILFKRGHKIVWWTSAFNHFTKQFHEISKTCLEYQTGYDLMFLRGFGYSRNVSLSRIRDHRQLGCQFRSMTNQMETPDVILCSYPTIELALEAAKFSKKRHLPVVLDIRDLWPDIYWDLLPKRLQWLGRIGTWPLEYKARKAFRAATAFTGNTDEMIHWALDRIGRDKGALDRSFPMGYPEKQFTPNELAEVKRFWDDFGVTKSKWELIVCFFGALGSQSSIETVLKAAGQRIIQDRKIAFVICGVGDYLDRYRKLSAGKKNIFLPGWVNAPAIKSLMERSDIGLLCYFEDSSYSLSLPNKVFEYFSGELAVLSSIRKGPLARILKDFTCGLTYHVDDSESFSFALLSLCDDRERCKLMGKSARRAYKDHFSAEIVYNQMADHLEMVAREWRSSWA